MLFLVLLALEMTSRENFYFITRRVASGNTFIVYKKKLLPASFAGVEPGHAGSKYHLPSQAIA